MFTLAQAPARPFSDIFTMRYLEALHIDNRIDALRTRMTEPQSMLSNIIDACRANNPWEVMESRYEQIIAAPDSAKCLLHLLKDAENVRRSVGDRSDIAKELNLMVGRICMTAENRLNRYRDYEAATYAWETARKRARKLRASFDQPRPKLTEGCWPADIYRAFGPAIHFGMQVGNPQAAKTYKSLVLESTLPVDELENPDWVDPYTGESEKREKPIAIRATFADWEEEAAFIQDEQLNWTQEDFVAFQNAQRGGFNADADAAPVLFDETDTIEKEFQFTGDWSTTEEAAELRSLLRQEIAALRKKIEATFATYQVAAALTEGDLSDAIRETHTTVISSAEAKRLMRMLKAQASSRTPQDVAAVALEFQSEFCWSVEDLNQIRVNNMGLGDWIEMVGEDFLDQFQDASPNWEEISQEEIDLYSDDTVFVQAFAYAPQKIREATMAISDTNKALAYFWNAVSNWRSRTPGDHPLFIAGTMNAAIAGTTTHDGQIAAGWEAFRSGTCPEGNKAYHTARANGVPHSQAMRAFWQLYNQKFPKQVKILKPFTDGLLLEGGRKVNWHVAALKLAADELAIDKDDARRLHDALVARSVGSEFTSALVSKFSLSAIPF
jgi:hypothetical protein